jgi:hypothetical protein
MASAPAPPDEFTGTTEDWLDFKGIWATWLETATREEILAEIKALGDVEGPLRPNEQWRHQECDLRLRQPVTSKAKPTKAKE